MVDRIILKRTFTLVKQSFRDLLKLPPVAVNDSIVPQGDIYNKRTTKLSQDFNVFFHCSKCCNISKYEF